MLTIENSVIRGNSARYGRGIYAVQGSVTVLVNGSVRDNQAVSGSGGGVDGDSVPGGPGIAAELVVAVGVAFSGNQPGNCAPGICVLVP